MKIVKVLNHNAVLIHDQVHNQILLAMYAGIGFGKKVSELIDVPDDAKIYHLESSNSKGNTNSMLHKLDSVYIEISGEILEYAKATFENIDENIILPLADHIAFAINRMEQNLAISNPFANEIKLLYPEAYKIAEQAKPVIKERLGVEISDDEVGYITLHIHSAADHSNQEGMIVAIIINESIQEIAREFNKEIDVNSLSYSRLMVHMKYLLARLEENEILTLDMEAYAKSTIPQSYEVATRIIKRIEGALNKLVPQVETGYLAMHIERILS